MFIYLLIFIELAILYGVYWFIFVRKPRVYRVKSTIWGEYTHKEDDDTYLLLSDEFPNGMTIEKPSNVVQFPQPEPPFKKSA